MVTSCTCITIATQPPTCYKEGTDRGKCREKFRSTRIGHVTSRTLSCPCHFHAQNGRRVPLFMLGNDHHYQVACMHFSGAFLVLMAAFTIYPHGDLRH